MRLPPKRLVELAIGAADGGGAINVSRSSEPRGNLPQRHVFTINVIAAPGKCLGVARGIDRGTRGGVQAPRRGPAKRRRAHRTFITTSVRSSVMAAPRVN